MMSAPATSRVSTNIRQTDDGVLHCAHCDAELPGTVSTVFDHLPRREATPSAAGPHVGDDSSLYVDTEVVFRQYYCPGCWTAFRTDVVPREAIDHPTL